MATRDRSKGKETSKGKKSAYDGEDSEIGKLVKDSRKRMGNHVAHVGIAAAGNHHIETGVFSLDMGLLGGFQESRVNMAYGWEGAGKSTLVMRAAAAAQRKHPDKVIALVDAEGTYDPTWGAAQGIDPERLTYFQPDSGEQAVDIIEAAIRSKETCSVILDSVPAIVPQTMIDRSAEDKTMAVRASLMGVCCSKILAGLNAERGRKHHPSVILVNQWRRKVGFVMGDNRILPGGDQLRFLCSVMVEAKKTPKLVMGKDKYDNDMHLANNHAFDIDKLKGGAGLKQGEFKLVVSDDYKMSDADKDMPDINLKAGTIDDYKIVINFAKRMGFITGGGASWKMDEIDGKFGKLDKIVEFLVENDDEFVILKRKMIALKRSELGLPPIPNDGYLLGHVS